MQARLWKSSLCNSNFNFSDSGQCYRSSDTAVGRITSQRVSIGHIALDEGAAGVSKLSVQLCFALFSAGLVQVEHTHLRDTDELMTFVNSPRHNTDRCLLLIILLCLT